jgi:hypothetical protein
MVLWVDDKRFAPVYDEFIKAAQEISVKSDEQSMPLPEKISRSEYTIRVKGGLDELDWTGWFGEMAILHDENGGETTLKGPIADSAELYGVISRLRNLGLVLISVEPSKENE